MSLLTDAELAEIQAATADLRSFLRDPRTLSVLRRARSALLAADRLPADAYDQAWHESGAADLHGLTVILEAWASMAGLDEPLNHDADARAAWEGLPTTLG